MVFTTKASSVIVDDVLIGELWVQGGQSNMQKTVSETGRFREDIKPKKDNNEIRLFYNTESLKTPSRAKDLDGKWMVATVNNVDTYSAVGYVALEKLNQELGIPVGGICNAIGGTAMGPFQGPVAPGGESYNAKTAPLTQFNIRGVMWYQGVADRYNKDFASDFEKLIKSWRTDWQDADMPFIFVNEQPSPMKYYASWVKEDIAEDWSDVRIAQLEVYHRVNNVGMAVAIDCPPLVGKEDALHPGNKKPVGQRLALSALGLCYGIEDKWSSPLYQTSKANGNSAVITLSHVYDGLKTTDAQAPRCFMAAGADGVFYEATAEISGKDTITITCPKVSNIEQISYAIEKHMYPYSSVEDMVKDTYADVNLVNSQGLPLCPFVYKIHETKPEKVQSYYTTPIEKVVNVGEVCKLDSSIALTDKSGKSVNKPVKWAMNTIPTNVATTVKTCGLIDGMDVVIPVTVTVKNADTSNGEEVTSLTQSNKNLSVSVPTDTEIKNVYIIAIFFDKDGKLMNTDISSAEGAQITKQIAIPEGAAKVELVTLDNNLKQYLKTAMLNIQ